MRERARKGEKRSSHLLVDLFTVCKGDSLRILSAAVFGGGVQEAGVREGNSRIPRERRVPPGLSSVSSLFQFLSLAYAFVCACRPSLSQSLDCVGNLFLACVSRCSCALVCATRGKSVSHLFFESPGSQPRAIRILPPSLDAARRL